MSIGLDKTKVKAFTVTLIDFEKFKRNKSVIYKEDVFGIGIQSTMGEILNFDYLKITDGFMFNTLTLGVKKNKGVINPYSFIEIHISHGDERNLKPITIEEYHVLLKQIRDYIEAEYGVSIDFSEAKFEQVEVNITSPMELKFESYEYLLSQMIMLLPRRYAYSLYVGKDRVTKQFDFYNKSIQGKIYDKTKQLKEVHNINIDKQYMRIEYTLNKPSKIKSCLKNEFIYGIKDEDIEEWITNQIKKDLVNPIQQHIKKVNNTLLKVAEEEKSMDIRKWTRNFINRAMALRETVTRGKLVLVTDMSQVMNLIEELTSKSNAKRTNNRLKNIYTKYEFVNGNFEKLKEIIEKFT